MYQKLSSFHLTHSTLIISYLRVVALIICNFLYSLGFIGFFYVLFFYLRIFSFFYFILFFCFIFPPFLSILFFLFYPLFFHFLLPFLSSIFLHIVIYYFFFFPFFFFLFFFFPFFPYFLILYLDGNAFLIITRGFPFLFLF